MKTCTKCKVEKDESEFPKNACKSDGLNRWCRECFSKHRAKDLESWEETQKNRKEEDVLLASGKKLCSKCKAVKDVCEFYESKKNRLGYRAWCKRCCGKIPKKVRDAQKARSKERYANNPEYRERILMQNKRSRRLYPDRVREAQRKYRKKIGRFESALKSSAFLAKRYGYEPCNATADELESAFDGRCAICRVPEQECNRKLSMDHNHEVPGDFRGWLCDRCNTMLGMARDSQEILIDAVHYLMAHQHQK